MYPRYTREQDLRYKLSVEEEIEMAKMRKEGHAYKNIGDKFNVSEGRAYLICMKHMDPEKYKAYLEKRRKYIGKYKPSSPELFKKLKARKSEICPSFKPSEAKRSLEYYRKNRAARLAYKDKNRDEIRRKMREYMRNKRSLTSKNNKE